MAISRPMGCHSQVRGEWLSVGHQGRGAWLSAVPEAVIHRAEWYGYQQGQRLSFTGQRYGYIGPETVIHRAERYGYQ